MLPSRSFPNAKVLSVSGPSSLGLWQDAGNLVPDRAFAEAVTKQVNSDESYYAAREKLLAKFDRQYLTRVVLRAGGNVSKAARIARVDRTTFYRLMERHGLQRNLLATNPE